MQPMHTLSSTALLVYASSALAQETDIRWAYPKEDIDEIVVVGVSRRGSWLIEHYRLRRGAVATH